MARSDACTGCTVCRGAMDGKERRMYRMYRMYGQIFASAISALPPSMVVVCRGAMDGKERRMYRMYGQIFAPRQLLLRCSNMLHPCNYAKSALPPSMAVVFLKKPGMAVRCSWVIYDYKKTISPFSG